MGCREAAGADLGVRINKVLMLGSELHGGEGGESRTEQTPPVLAVRGSRCGPRRKSPTVAGTQMHRPLSPESPLRVATLETAQSFALLLGLSAFTCKVGRMPPLPASNNGGQLSPGAVQAQPFLPRQGPMTHRWQEVPSMGAGSTQKWPSQLWRGWSWSHRSQPVCAQKALPCSLEHEGTRAFTLIYFITYKDVFVARCKWVMLSTPILISSCNHKVVRLWILEPSAWVRIQALRLLSCVTQSKSPNFSVPQLPNV